MVPPLACLKRCDVQIVFRREPKMLHETCLKLDTYCESLI